MKTKAKWLLGNALVAMFLSLWLWWRHPCSHIWTLDTPHDNLSVMIQDSKKIAWDFSYGIDKIPSVTHYVTEIKISDQFAGTSYSVDLNSLPDLWAFDANAVRVEDGACIGWAVGENITSYRCLLFLEDINKHEMRHVRFELTSYNEEPKVFLLPIRQVK